MMTRSKSDEPAPAPVSTSPSAEAAKATLVSQMFQAGVHFGHKKSKWHPKMAPYVYGVRNNIHIIDLSQTYDLLQRALGYLAEVASNGGTILLVGTRTHASAIIEQAAKACGMPYVNKRWVGGTFTNFEVVSKRLEHFRKLERDFAAGAFEKYTKREQLEIQRKIASLTEKWGGLKNLPALPQAMFILDISEDALAVKEARAKGVPVVALTDTNTDPTLVDYPIPANDDSISSTRLLVEEVTKAIQRGRAKAPSPARAPIKPVAPSAAAPAVRPARAGA